MPSIAAHMIVAELVSKNLKINNNDFIRGNILPDIICSNDSHYRINGKYYLIPNVLDYVSKINSYEDLGYYVHLLTDKYYLEDFLYQNVGIIDVFNTKMIYNDYSKINYQLVKLANLNVNYLKKILTKYDVQVDLEKLKYNLNCLSLKNIGRPQILDCNKLYKFLVNISKIISKEIKIYASKFSS